MSKSFDIDFNNPLYRKRIMEDKYTDNEYKDFLNALYTKTTVSQLGGTIALYSEDDNQTDSYLSDFGQTVGELKDKVSSYAYTLLPYSKKRGFNELDYKIEEVIREEERFVINASARVVYKDYLKRAVKALHTKVAPVELKLDATVLDQIQGASLKLDLPANKLVMTHRTAASLVSGSKPLQDEIKSYRVPVTNYAEVFKQVMGMDAVILPLSDITYDGFVYMLYSAAPDILYTKNVPLRHIRYSGNYAGSFCVDGESVRRFRVAQEGVGGKYYAQFTLIASTNVDNPKLVYVLKLPNTKAIT